MCTFGFTGSGYTTLSHYPADQDTFEVLEGETEVCVAFLVEAFPSASILWSKDGVNMTNETYPLFSVMREPLREHVEIVSACLQNLSVADGGSYTITATNGYERKNLSAQVVILGKLK